MFASVYFYSEILGHRWPITGSHCFLVHCLCECIVLVILQFFPCLALLCFSGAYRPWGGILILHFNFRFTVYIMERFLPSWSSVGMPLARHENELWSVEGLGPLAPKRRSLECFHTGVPKKCSSHFLVDEKTILYPIYSFECSASSMYGWT